MMSEPLAFGAMIAERELAFSDGRTITIRLGTPQRDPQLGRDWFCPYSISGPAFSRTWRSFGVDAFQAIQLAMKSIETDVTAINRADDGSLRWDELEAGDFGPALNKSNDFGSALGNDDPPASAGGSPQ